MMTYKKAKPPQFAGSLKDLAVALGLPYRRVWRWSQDPAFPARGPKGWEVAVIQAWAGMLHQARTMAPDPKRKELRERLEEARAEKEEHRGQLLKLQLEIQRGEYRPLREIEAWDRARTAVVKRGLLAFAKSLPPLLVGLTELDMAVVIDRRVRDLVRRFGQFTEKESSGEGH